MEVKWVTDGKPAQLVVEFDGNVITFDRDEALQLHLGTEAACNGDCRCFLCGKDEGQREDCQCK